MKPNIEIDFRVTSDLYFLHIHDLSCWGIAKEKPAVIEITMPGYSKPVKRYFYKEDTSYNAASLDMICDDVCPTVELPDGVYHILIKASPDKFFAEYDYLKTDILQRDFDVAYIESLNSDCKDCKRKDLLNIEFQKKVADAYIRKGLIKDASFAYKTARKEIDKIIKCKNC